MSGEALFGRYWVADSAIHHLDPRTKVLAALAFVVVVFIAQSFAALGALALFLAAVFALAHIPPSQALRSIAPLAFIIALTALFNLLFVQGGHIFAQWGPFTISQEGVCMAAFVSLRLLLLLASGSLLTLTTPSLAITDAFEWLLQPLARVRFPAHEFAFIMGLALRFLPLFAEELKAIRTAQLARGAKLATSPLKSGLASFTALIVPLFTSAFRHAETLSFAMEARCYHGATGRTRLHPLRFRRADALAAGTFMALAVLTVGLNLLQ